eukprot:6931021-Prymnesium_polylepis.1
MSIGDKYCWLLGCIEEEAGGAEGEAYEKAVMTYIDTQEELRYSKAARAEKTACEIAREKIYDVVEPIGDLSLTKKEFNALARAGGTDRLRRRATACTIPVDEQRKVYERLRRNGKTTHPLILTPVHTQSELLGRIANLLGCGVARMLSATTWTEDDAWVQMHNRIRRSAETAEDKHALETTRDWVRTLGVKVHSKAGLQFTLDALLRYAACD